MLSQKFLGTVVARFRHSREGGNPSFFFVFSMTPTFTCTHAPGGNDIVVVSTNLRDNVLGFPLQEIRQDLSRLSQIAPGDEKPNRDVPAQVKVLALGEIRYFFRFENRFYERDLTCIRRAKDLYEIDKLRFFLSG
jgi:hypothetical protein